MIVGLVSAKGSPGVTTAAVALAAVAADGLLVELDPSGGSVECLTGETDESGLIRVAHQMARSSGAEVVDACARRGPSGVEAILAPTAGRLAESTIRAADSFVATVLPAVERTVVVDGGRWSPSDVTASRLIGCGAVGVVCRPTVPGIEAARWLVEPLQVATRAQVGLVLVGDRPYSRREVEEATGVLVAATISWDPRAVDALFKSPAPSRGWARTRLARSARVALERLASDAHPWQVVGGA